MLHLYYIFIDTNDENVVIDNAKEIQMKEFDGETKNKVECEGDENVNNNEKNDGGKVVDDDDDDDEKVSTQTITVKVDAGIL